MIPNALTEVTGQIDLNCSRRPFANNNYTVLLEMYAIVFVCLRERIQATVMCIDTIDPIVNDVISAE